MRRVLHPAIVVSFALALTACPPAEQDQQASTTAKAKSEPTPEVPAAEQIREAKGIEIGALTPEQRETFFTLINAEPSACDKPHSLATSLRDDPECRDSTLVAQLIADRLAAGMTATDIKAQLDAIKAALVAEEIDIEGRPIYGNPKAPITVVVFADFQCPRCKAEAPELREEIDERRGQVRLVFKHFPLSGHPRAEPAAIAVEAAGLQGKFWEMHDLVFANQLQLEDADLESYAAKIPELDLAKWKADVAAAATKVAVDKDRAEGKRLKIGGTPTVFVNGRQVTPLLWDGELSAWIDDALRR